METVFISYAREDHEIALSIFNLLEENGFSPWIDIKKIVPGQDWELEIDKAIRNSKIFLACLSTKSVSKRGFFQSELRKAMRVLDSIPEDDVYLIPIRLDDCKVPSRIERYQWLDYSSDQGPDRLLHAITHYVNGPLRSVQETAQSTGNGSMLPIDSIDNLLIPEEPDQNAPIKLTELLPTETTEQKLLPAIVSVETLGGISSPIFYANTQIPTKKLTQIFSTAQDNQFQVEIHLLLGPNRFAAQNRSLGSFIFDGIPPAPRGIPQIELSFFIGDDYNLNLTAHDLQTNQIKHFREMKLTNYPIPPVYEPIPDVDFPNKAQSIVKGIMNLLTSKPSVNESGEFSQLRDITKVTIDLSLEEAVSGIVKDFKLKNSGRIMRLKIPGGVDSGNWIRYEGRGVRGEDLYVFINVLDHPLFTRDHGDIHLTIPISERFASAGGQIRVPTLTEHKFNLLDLPLNTIDGTEYHIKGLGIKSLRNDKAGDLIIRINVYNPRNLSAEVRMQLLNLKDALGDLEIQVE